MKMIQKDKEISLSSGVKTLIKSIEGIRHVNVEFLVEPDARFFAPIGVKVKSGAVPKRSQHINDWFKKHF